MNEELKAELERLMGEATKGLVSEESIKGLSSMIEDEAKKTKDVENQLKGLIDDVTKLKETNVSKAEEKTKHALYEFFEKNLNSGRDAGVSKKIDVKVADIMFLNNSITPVGGADGFSPLWRSFIDDEIASAPKPEPKAMMAVSVRTSENIYQVLHSSRVNEEGDAEFRDEGEIKALIDAEYQTSQVKVKNLAEIWTTSTEYDESAPEL